MYHSYVTIRGNYIADHAYIGLMPTSGRLLAYFPESSFLLYIISNDPKEGEMVLDGISDLDNPNTE